LGTVLGQLLTSVIRVRVDRELMAKWRKLLAAGARRHIRQPVALAAGEFSGSWPSRAAIVEFGTVETVLVDFERSLQFLAKAGACHHCTPATRRMAAWISTDSSGQTLTSLAKPGHSRATRAKRNAKSDPSDCGKYRRDKVLCSSCARFAEPLFVGSNPTAACSPVCPELDADDRDQPVGRVVCVRRVINRRRVLRPVRGTIHRIIALGAVLAADALDRPRETTRTKDAGIAS
jgi:hypothetical protein